MFPDFLQRDDSQYIFLRRRLMILSLKLDRWRRLHLVSSMSPIAYLQREPAIRLRSESGTEKFVGEMSQRVVEVEMFG